MPDRIAVMNRGRVEQVASPTEIYDHPATLFVNQFVGTANLLPDERLSVDDASSEVRLESAVLRAAPVHGLTTGAKVMVSGYWCSIRPLLARACRSLRRKSA